MTANAGERFWWHQLGVPEPRPALPSSIDPNGAVVGAGFTGLWTAYCLKKARPDLWLAVLRRGSPGLAPGDVMAGG